MNHDGSLLYRIKLCNHRVNKVSNL
uniref:Uncharacterized protein n=1 Tax=Arundo donax TaxID=35708 RepID=A0A0A9H8Z1_ARUDO